MANLETITISAGAGDTVKEGIRKNRDNAIKIDENRIDTSDPTTPNDGVEWVRSDGANNGQKYAQINGAKTEILYQHKINDDLDLQGNEIKNFRAEQLATGSLPTPAAGTSGEIPFDLTVERHASIDSADQYYLARFKVDGTEYFGIRIPLEKGVVDGPATNPTPDSLKNEISGWLFDATNEELLLSARVPAGWTGGHDLLLRTGWWLNQAETANDDLEVASDWATITPGVDSASKAEETSATAATDIGSGTADGTFHWNDVVIDYAAIGNVIAANDLLRMIVRRVSVGGAGKVGGAILSEAWLLIPAFDSKAA